MNSVVKEVSENEEDMFDLLEQDSKDDKDMFDLLEEDSKLKPQINTSVSDDEISSKLFLYFDQIFYN